MYKYIEVLYERLPWVNQKNENTNMNFINNKIKKYNYEFFYQDDFMYIILLVLVLYLFVKLL
jgi:DNA modification methylase